MKSFPDDIVILADSKIKRLVKVRVEKADFKLECYMCTIMNFKEKVHPTGLCAIEAQQKLLLADSGTDGGLLVISLKDGTTLKLLQNGSNVCYQIRGLCLRSQSVVFVAAQSCVTFFCVTFLLYCDGWDQARSHFR